MSPPYDAFISYSHKANGQLAPKLERELQRFAKPWYQARSVRIFRDESSLSATPALWPEIEEALQNSMHFLLLASPEAAKSEWVQKEVAWWLEHKSLQTLLIALTDGQIKREAGAKDFDWERTDALPPNLKGLFVETPLWVDLRWANDPDQLTPEHPEFQNALAALAAPLRGLSKDELISEEAVQHRRTKQTAWAAGLALTALTLAAVAFGIRSFVAEGDARRSNSQLLAQQSEIIQGEREIELAALLSRAAFDSGDTPAARRALLQSIVQGPLATLGKGVPQGEDEHQQPIKEVGFSPAGDAVVSLDAEGMLRVWKLPATTAPAAGTDVGQWVDTVEVSRDGTTIMAVGATGVSLWDFNTLDPKCALRSDDVASAAFHVDGESIIIATNDDVIRAGIATAPDAACPQYETLGSAPDPAYITAVTVAANRWVSAGHADGSVSLWRPQGAGWTLHSSLSQPGAARTAEGRAPAIRRLAFNPAGSELVAANGQGVIVHWDVSSDVATGELLADTAGVIEELTFDASGETLVFADQSGKVELWDTHRWEHSASFNLDLVDALSVAVSPDLSRLATGGHGGDGATRLWSLADSPLAGDPLQIGELSGVTAVAFDASSTRFAIAGADQSVRICEAPSEVSCEDPISILSRVNALAFSPDGTWLAIGEEVGKITIISRTGDDLHPVSLDGYRVVSLAFSADGATLAATGIRTRAMGNSGNPEETIALWDVETREQRDMVSGDSAGIAVAFSPRSSVLAAGGGNQTVAWTEADGTLSKRKIVGGSASSVQGLAFSHDGNRIAGGLDDGSVEIWDVTWGPDMVYRRNERLVDELITASTTSVAFSPDDRYLASSHSDGTVALWSVADQAPIGLLGWFDDAIAGVSWSERGSVVAIVGDGSYVELPGNPDIWKVRVCEVAGRDLVPAEAERYIGDESRRVCPELFGGELALMRLPLST